MKHKTLIVLITLSLIILCFTFMGLKIESNSSNRAVSEPTIETEKGNLISSSEWVEHDGNITYKFNSSTYMNDD